MAFTIKSKPISIVVSKNKPSGAPYSIDFTKQLIEDPLSIGGIWSNNTQGVGGNVAPNNLGNMRIDMSSNGNYKIAQHALAAVVGYDDSFAFVPNISTGNIRITATVFRDPQYRPQANHEIELILGCSTSQGGNHRWMECLWNSQGGVDIVNLDGGPNDFTSIGGATGQVNVGPKDGDIWIAELYRNSKTVKWWVNGVLACSATHSLISNLGSGAGIAAFRRPGDTNSAAMGFRNFKCESF